MANSTGIMFGSVTIIAILIAGPSAVLSADFIVTHSPDYLRFHANSGPISTSDIPAVMTAAFGFTPKHDVKWSGLEHGSLFHRPKANILVSLYGVENLELPHATRFAVDVDVPEVDTDALATHLQGSAQGHKSLIIDVSEHNSIFDIRAQHPTLFGHLPATLDEVKHHLAGEQSALRGMSLSSLKPSLKEDAAFLGEIQIIHEMLEALKARSDAIKDNAPDLFHFRLNGVSLIAARDGSTSEAVKDATAILHMFINKITEDFKTLYKGNVLVEVVTLPGIDGAHIRKSRSLMQAKGPTPASVPISTLIGVSPFYGTETAAIFNIILWTLVILALSIVAVSVSMWTMDPGRDSIIYRMTSQRIKKD